MDVYDILNDKSKGQPNQLEGDQLEETSNNVIANDDMLADSIGHHESQCNRNLVPSHSKANDSVMPPTDTVSEQDYDASLRQIYLTIHRCLMNPESVLE